jgi:GH25 family lysozyme M1 (1,4-beta-N-acetylmuramidase)
MSRDAYIEVYGQEPPPNAHFGADISYWQDRGVWADLVTFAEFVNIRCSYGRNSEDGKQNLHVQWADEHGYNGKLGGYHFYYAGNPSAQANNYLYQSSDIRDRLSHHMVDAEAAPIAGIGELEEWCQIVEQATGQPTIIYSGWSYLNGSGSSGRHLWLPHYASRSYTAWNGTPGSWDSWNAPYTPDWYGQRNPTVWQFTSLTNRHGHLDVNIGTEPMAQLFGLGQSQEDEFLSAAQYDAIMAKLDQLERSGIEGLISFVRDNRNGQIWLVEGTMWRRYIGSSTELHDLQVHWAARGADPEVYDWTYEDFENIPRADLLEVDVKAKANNPPIA